MTRAATAAFRGASPVRVLIVDDHAVVRRGLRAYLEALADVEVAGEAADGRAALLQLAKAATTAVLPDVVLMDLLMPGPDGVATTAAIRERYPSVRVVVVTSFGEAERVHAALAAGAVGYLLKDADPDEVGAAVRAAARGEVHLGGRVASGLVGRLTAPRTGVAALTPRERDVLALVADGCANREIADALLISERTARTHVSNVLAKLGVTSRTQAALIAIRDGLVPPPGSGRMT